MRRRRLGVGRLVAGVAIARQFQVAVAGAVGMGDSQSKCCGSCDKQAQMVLERDGQQYTTYGMDETPQTAAALSPSTMTEPAVNALSRGPGPEPPFVPERVTFAATIKEPRMEKRTVDLLVDVAKLDAAEDLGLRVLHGGIGLLVVAEIYTGGAVDSSNARLRGANRGPCLEVGDQIAMVNGVGGDDQAMAEECKRAQHLRLGVRRNLPAG